MQVFSLGARVLLYNCSGVRFPKASLANCDRKFH